MTLAEYERFGKRLYEEFAKLVATLLSEEIAKRGEIKLQHVQHRPKGLKSLSDKLVKQEVPADDPQIERKIKDLAGCRLVFYTNTDVGRFRQSGLINDLFEIDWDRTKFHYPTDETSNQFRSDNIVIRLTDSMLSSAEFASFKDLTCEVQVQTALNHAWSEMEHDIYKKPVLKGFGAARMRSIEERMEKIMKEHLLPAGYEFQKIRDDFDRLAAGKALFDQDALRSLEAATDNNTRFELLEQFSTYVLPDYDDISAVQGDIRNTMAQIIRAARTTRQQPIETTFGRLEGKTFDQVFEKAMDVIERVRYAGSDSVERTFDLLCELYRDATSEDQKNHVLQCAEHLAKNELDVWRQAGPIVQHILAERILQMDLDQAGSIRPVLLKVLEELLNLEVTGTSSTYKTFTWTTQAAEPSDALISIRASAIQSLERWFQLSMNDEERQGVVRTLIEATRTPSRGDYPDELLHIVWGNTLDIVRFFSSQVSSLSFKLLQKVEHDFLWLYRWNQEVPADAQHGQVIHDIKQQIASEILAFRDQINQDEGFVTYKILVGFESVFLPAWDNPDFEVHAEQVYRDGEIQRLAEGVDEQNADRWLGIIRRCAQTKSNNFATFPGFEKFLERLATKKPAIAMRYLDDLDRDLEPLIPALLRGLDVSAADAAKAKIVAWVADKRYLERILWYYRFSSNVDFALLKRAAVGGMEVGEERAVSIAVEVAAVRYKDMGEEVIEGVLLPGIDWLEQQGYRHWLGGGISIVRGEDSPFRNLTEQQAHRVLDYLVARESIDIRLDQLLEAIGNTHPKVLVDFLGSRVRLERELRADQEALGRYDAVPFQFHKANEALKKVLDYMLEQMQTWYREDSELFSFRAGRLTRSVYNKITPELAAAFMSLIETGDMENLRFVLELLERFEGAEQTRPLYKAIISKAQGDDALLRSVGTGLASTGVVSGEFGMTEAYKERRAAVVRWLEDSDEKVRHFAKTQVAVFDCMIATEQRRAEEDLELRKRTWSTGLGDDTAGA